MTDLYEIFPALSVPVEDYPAGSAINWQPWGDAALVHPRASNVPEEILPDVQCKRWQQLARARLQLQSASDPDDIALGMHVQMLRGDYK